jgi:hypothetical protein
LPTFSARVSPAGDRAGACPLVAGGVELATVHIKRSHRDEDMLAEAVTQATRDQRIRSYFTKRFLEYLRWLDDGSANNLILYYSLRIPAIVLSA